MKCPYCGKDNNTVINTQNHSNPNKLSRVKRMRKCLECNKNFKTLEEIDVGSMFQEYTGRKRNVEIQRKNNRRKKHHR